jgi:hypothetical protein
MGAPCPAIQDDLETTDVHLQAGQLIQLQAATRSRTDKLSLPRTQKLMSAPILGEQGEVLGVVQTFTESSHPWLLRSYCSSTRTINTNVLQFFWIPEETARIRSEKDRVPYDQWIKEGLIKATEVTRLGYLVADRVR